jgi:hypothetical protein
LTSGKQIVYPPAPQLYREWPAQLYPGGRFVHDFSIAYLA